MKSIEGWWFGTTKKRLSWGDNRHIKIGRTHKIKGDIIPCKRGLHLSKKMIDAVNLSSGPVVYRVRGSGTIIPHGDPNDKYACSERTYLYGGVDCSGIFDKFSRLCALDVAKSWDAPDIVIEYLKTGNKNLKQRAFNLAYDYLRKQTLWETKGHNVPLFLYEENTRCAMAIAVLVCVYASHEIFFPLMNVKHIIRPLRFLYLSKNSHYDRSNIFNPYGKDHYDKLNRRLTQMVTKYIKKGE